MDDSTKGLIILGALFVSATGWLGFHEGRPAVECASSVVVDYEVLEQAGEVCNATAGCLPAGYVKVKRSRNVCAVWRTQEGLLFDAVR